MLDWLRLALTAVSIVLFCLRLFAGKQTQYALLAFEHLKRLKHGDILCPRCLGHPEGDGIHCFFCLECSSEGAKKRGTPFAEWRFGYVTWSYLTQRWDMRHWREKPAFRPAAARMW
jgi:hypothetical protein